MHHFWRTIIEPVLDALQPEILVEIGSDYGHNTKNLLEFCQRSDAKLHVIDPLPKYLVASWQERYGDRLIFHPALSLEAIPLIDRFDVVLIDGDHNWYTVFNELKLIEGQCAKSSRPFPLVMLHDIGWPYGRRDVYYDPQTIPNVYRKPYEKKGMKPESTKPLEKGGLNRGLCNAAYEGGPQNGVLTAVEDFLDQTERLVELVKVPGLHGLGIIVPIQLKKQNGDLAQLLEALSLPPIVARYIEQVERVRLEAEVAWEESARSKDIQLQAVQEIMELVPEGEAFILVDEDSWVTDDELGGRRRIPFLERDGQYWDAPPDDATAIRQLERLRQETEASFMVFAWPAFWWLEYYAGLRDHLRSEYRCVLENERLVAFDLR